MKLLGPPAKRYASIRYIELGLTGLYSTSEPPHVRDTWLASSYGLCSYEKHCSLVV